MKMTNFISKGSVQVEAKIDSTFNSHHNASQEVENKLLQMNVVLQRLQSPLQCTICLDLLESPVTTKCGHSYCSRCMQQLLNGVRGAAPCPLCLTPTTKRSLSVNAPVLEKVNAVRKIIDSIKKDCGFLALPASKAAPTPHIEDNSDEEEMDEPRRGTRKRPLLPALYSENGIEDSFNGRKAKEKRGVAVGRANRGRGRGRGSLPARAQDTPLLAHQESKLKVSQWIKSSSKLGFEVGESQNTETSFTAKNADLDNLVQVNESISQKPPNDDDAEHGSASQTSTVIFDVSSYEKEVKLKNITGSEENVCKPDLLDDELPDIECNMDDNKSINPIFLRTNESSANTVNKNDNNGLESAKKQGAKDDMNSTACSDTSNQSSLDKNISRAVDTSGSSSKNENIYENMPPPTKPSRGRPVGRPPKTNTRYASNSKKLLNPSMPAVSFIEPKDSKSPGWSHIARAQKDLKTRHIGLNIIGGDGKSELASNTAALFDDNRMSSSGETEINIDEQTQGADGQKFDIEHLDTMPEKRENVNKLRSMLKNLNAVESKKSNLVESIPEKHKNIITSVPDTQATEITAVTEGVNLINNNHDDQNQSLNKNVKPQNFEISEESKGLKRRVRSANDIKKLNDRNIKKINEPTNQPPPDMEEKENFCLNPQNEKKYRSEKHSKLSRNFANTNIMSSTLHSSNANKVEELKSFFEQSSSNKTELPSEKKESNLPSSSSSSNKVRYIHIIHDNSDEQSEFVPEENIVIPTIYKNKSLQVEMHHASCDKAVQCSDLEVHSVGVQCDVVQDPNFSVERRECCSALLSLLNDKSSVPSCKWGQAAIEMLRLFQPFGHHHSEVSSAVEDNKESLKNTKESLKNTKESLKNTKESLKSTKESLTNTKETLTNTKESSNSVVEATSKSETVLPAVIPLPVNFSNSSIPPTIILPRECDAEVTSGKLYRPSKRGKKLSGKEMNGTNKPARVTRQTSKVNKELDIFSTDLVDSSKTDTMLSSTESLKAPCSMDNISQSSKLDLRGIAQESSKIASPLKGLPEIASRSEAELQISPSKMPCDESNGRYKRIRFMNSESSSDEDEPSKKKKRKSSSVKITSEKDMRLLENPEGNDTIHKNQLTPCSSENNNSGVNSNHCEKNSEEMRLDEFDEKLFEYFGYDQKTEKDIMESNKATEAFDDLPEIDGKNPSVTSPSKDSDADDVIPSTAEVFNNNVEADFDLIKRSRQQKKSKSQETVELDPSQNSVVEITNSDVSSPSRKLMEKCSESLLKVENVLKHDTMSRESQQTACNSKNSATASSKANKNSSFYLEDKMEETGTELSHLSMLSTQSEIVSTQYRDKVQNEVDILKAKMKALQQELSHYNADRKSNGTEEDLFVSYPELKNNNSPVSKDIQSLSQSSLLDGKASLSLSNPSLPKPRKNSLKIFMCTGLSSSEVAMVSKVSQKCSGSEVVKSWTPNVTHVIVRCCEDGTTDRTLKYLYGVASGCWVLNMNWVKKCLEVGTAIDEEPYEALDSTGVPGPERGRIHGKRLFKGASLFCVPPFSDVTLVQIHQLVQLCGGSMVSNGEELLVISEGLRLIIVQVEEGDEEGRQRAVNLYKKYKRVVVAYDWLIECIAMYALIGLQPYLLCEPELADLEASGVSVNLLHETQDLI